MARLLLELITAERVVFSDEVDIVVAPGSEGELGILPNHAALVTALDSGRLLVRQGAQETEFIVSGGFLEVSRNRVIVLADVAERSDEIDMERADEARRRAEERIRSGVGDGDTGQAEAELRRSMVRLRVGRRRRGTGGPTGSSPGTAP